MNKPNFNKQMRALMECVPVGERLLLHSCCGPCSTRCLEVLRERFSVTVLYYNPNIADAAEYEKRKGEQMRLLRETGWAEFSDADYDPALFFAAVKGLEGEPEGGARCTECFRLRLEYAARKASEGGWNWFSTTLTVSPHKDAPRINEIGAALGARYGVRWLPADFKKENGYLRSVRLSEQYGLYRQNFCGCPFSRRDPQ